MANGLTVDPLYVALTRPAMALGVPFGALLITGVVTAETFLLTRNLLTLGVCVPLHGLFWLLTQSEPRYFELAQLWGRCRAPAWFAGSFARWRASGYAPWPLDGPSRAGQRQGRLQREPRRC